MYNLLHTWNLTFLFYALGLTSNRKCVKSRENYNFSKLFTFFNTLHLFLDVLYIVLTCVLYSIGLVYIICQKSLVVKFLSRSRRKIGTCHFMQYLSVWWGLLTFLKNIYLENTPVYLIYISNHLKIKKMNCNISTFTFLYWI